jgi:hypothetical protein
MVVRVKRASRRVRAKMILKNLTIKMAMKIVIVLLKLKEDIMIDQIERLKILPASMAKSSNYNTMKNSLRLNRYSRNKSKQKKEN